MSTGTTDKDEYRRIKWNGWGSRDRLMAPHPANARTMIHPTGKKIHGFVDFIEKEVLYLEPGSFKMPSTPGVTMEEAMQLLGKPIINEPFLADLAKTLKADQLQQDGESRLMHVVGKNYRDLWRMRKGMINRSPDAVVLPESHADCVELMKLAHTHNVVIIPFGGGTNVTGGVEANPAETRRMVISVDMRRMSKMISVDKESRVATFEAGVLGPDLDEKLGRLGFMVGHDPDSYIHSTLGGWIAARGSGAYSNKYGDIEDMVLSLKLATPTGVIETPLASRQCGMDMAPMFIGSEGILGIITEATIKVEPVPKVRHYEGWLFPSFEGGFSAFNKVTKEGFSPVCMRLYDADETRLSMSLKTEAPWLQEKVSAGVKHYLQHVKRYDLRNLCVCIVGFEGHPKQVALERSIVTDIFNKANAFCVGKSAGDNWQEKKYDLPYVRDFALSHGFWADVFETTAMYGKAIGLWRAVKAAVTEVNKKAGKPGWIGCHTAHQYRHGCCMYFTFAGLQTDDADLAHFLKIKVAATEAMLRYQGNLSHHHGIGFEHVPWMTRHYSPKVMGIVQKIKADVDPKDICNPGKVLPVPRKERESDEQYEERAKKAQMFDKVGLPGQPLAAKM